MATKLPHYKVLSHRLRVALSCSNPGDSVVVLQCVALFGIMLDGIEDFSGTGPMGTHLPRTNYGPDFEKAVLPQGQPLVCSFMPQEARQRLRKAE